MNGATSHKDAAENGTEDGEEIYFRANSSVYQNGFESQKEIPTFLTIPGSVDSAADLSVSNKSEKLQDEKVKNYAIDSQDLYQDRSLIVNMDLDNSAGKMPPTPLEIAVDNKQEVKSDTFTMKKSPGLDLPPSNWRAGVSLELSLNVDEQALDREGSGTTSWGRLLNCGIEIEEKILWIFSTLYRKKWFNAETSKKSWTRSRVTQTKGQGRSILMTPAKKAERADKQLKTKRLRKVHFNLPKVNSSRRVIAQALDPRSPTVRRWQSIMLLPLSYELWVFPYRLALGAPSTASKIFAADLACDSLFLLDILVALCTAIPPAHPGDPAITSFSGIARRYFSVTFPTQFLPCTLYWVTTPICAYYLAQLCPDPLAATPSESAHRIGRDDGGQSSWDPSTPARRSGGGQSPYDSQFAVAPPPSILVNAWECVVLSSWLWPVWAWWLSTIPRIVPRALRLKSYFKAMESDLVRHSTPFPRRSQLGV